MNPLFLCDTYYQLIVAIQLKLTVFRDARACVCLTNHSIGANEVASRLRDLNLFDEVVFVENLDILKGAGGLKKASKFIQLNRRSTPLQPYCDYDTLIFFNISYAVYELVNIMCDSRNLPRLFRMEEGLLTCQSAACHDWRSNIKLSLLDDARRIGNRPRLSKKVEGFFCFIPELCDEGFPLEPIQIPSLASNRVELVHVLRQIFNYQGFDYKQKFVFFASANEIDGMSIGEDDVVRELAKHIGPSELIVKMHPRDRRLVYQGEGVSVIEGLNVPWEVVQLCDDMSDKVLLTCISGSPLAITALLNDGTRGVYLLPSNPTHNQIGNTKRMVEPISKTIDKLHDKGLCQSIVIQSIDEFLETGLN